MIKNSPNYSTEKAIQITSDLLSKKVCPKIMKLVLVDDGFSKAKAESIISWAKNSIKNELEQFPKQ